MQRSHDPIRATLTPCDTTNLHTERTAPVVNWTMRVLMICLLFAVFACAAGISQQARTQVTYSGPFAALQKSPDQHVGEILMLGGKVIETTGTAGASEITVLQLPLGTRDRPQDGDHSQGRYLIQSDDFLDPAIYQQGSLLTVVGKLSGGETRSIGSFQYLYPVVKAIEIKPWPREQQTGPRFHFGIGVGTSF